MRRTPIIVSLGKRYAEIKGLNIDNIISAILNFHIQSVDLKVSLALEWSQWCSVVEAAL
jgi:hypothetical protein